MEFGVSFSVYDITVPVMVHGLNVMDDYLDHAQALERTKAFEPGRILGERLAPDMLPFVKGLTLLFWATATWWIPMLLLLGAWRHVWRRFPLRYDVLYWGAVFPLGMYSAATFELVETIHAPLLLDVSRVFLYAGLAAWAVTLAGLVRHLAGLARRRGETVR